MFPTQEWLSMGLNKLHVRGIRGTSLSRPENLSRRYFNGSNQSQCSIHTEIIDPQRNQSYDDSKYPMQDKLISLLSHICKIKKFNIQSFRTISENQCLLQILKRYGDKNKIHPSKLLVPTDKTVETKDQRMAKSK
ncbi:hypothetical protein Tco_1255163 [Tanacetum coccineum]